MQSRPMFAPVVCTFAAVSLQADVIVDWHPDDNAPAIQAALDSGAARVILPLLDGGRNIWRVRRTVELRSNQELILSRGIVVQAEGTYFDEHRRSLLLAEDGSVTNGYQRATRIIVRGGDGEGPLPVVRMFKAEHTYPPDEHCLELLGAEHVTVRNIEFLEAGGDGLALSAYHRVNPYSRTPTDDVRVEDCVFTRNSRNGLWVGAARGCFVRRCTFQETSVEGGLSPSSGALVEPSFYDDAVYNVLFADCVSAGNVGPGFNCWLNSLNPESAEVLVAFERCIARNNGGSGFVCWARPGSFFGPAGFVELRDCVVQNAPDFLRPTGLGIEASLECYDYRLQFRFVRCRLTDTALAGGHPIRLELPPTTGLSAAGGMRFVDCIVEDCQNRCFLLVHELQFVIADWYDLGLLGDIGVTVVNPVYWAPTLPRQHELVSVSTHRFDCPGACCLPGDQCAYLLESECLALGGEPYSGWKCRFIDCEPRPAGGGDGQFGNSNGGE